MSARRSSGRLKVASVQKPYTERLGPRWEKPELLAFYDGYMKFGKNWEKIAGTLKDRTADMVEALFMQNKTFLSDTDATANSLNSVMQDMYNKIDEQQSALAANSWKGSSGSPSHANARDHHAGTTPKGAPPAGGRTRTPASPRAAAKTPMYSALI
eukprot:Opistho-2@7415